MAEALGCMVRIGVGDVDGGVERQHFEGAAVVHNATAMPGAAVVNLHQLESRARVSRYLEVEIVEQEESMIADERLSDLRRRM